MDTFPPEPPQPPPPSYLPAAAPEAPPPLPWETPGAAPLEALFETAKLLLLSPGEAYRRMPLTGGPGRPFAFAVLLSWAGVLVSFGLNLVFRSALTPFMPMQGMDWQDSPFGSTAVMAAMVVLWPIVLGIGLLIGTIIFHVLLLLLGAGQSGFEATFRVLCYATAPNVLLVIPFCGGLVAWIWSIVLEIIGLATAHRTSQGTAAVAVLLPMVLCCGAVLLLFGAAMAAIFAAAMG